MEDNMTPGGGPAPKVHESTAGLLDDFSRPAAPKAAPVKQMFSQDKEEDDDPPPAEEKKEKKLLSADLTAEILIGSIDSIQTLTFSAITRRKMKKRFGEDMDRLEAIVDKIDDKQMTKAEVPEKDLIQLKKIRKLIHVMDDIPFTEEEKEELKKPLSAIIEESNFKIPPSVALTLAIANVMAPRLVDAMTE